MIKSNTIIQSPIVSVIMPVYNGENFITGAICSILSQTLADLELIIVDDGSKDCTVEVIKTFTDHRINLIQNKQNLGNYVARNQGIDVATGKYIAVMDSDDIALSNRLQKQFEFMEAYPQFGICGSLAKVINSDTILTAPEKYNQIKIHLLGNMTFRHPTVFIRKEVLKRYGLKYNEAFKFAGDYEFLVRAAHLFPVTNIQEVLLHYRRHNNQISSKSRGEQSKYALKVVTKQLAFFKKDITENEVLLHLVLLNKKSPNNIDGLKFRDLINWANFLLERNNCTQTYDGELFTNYLRILLKNISNAGKNHKLFTK